MEIQPTVISTFAGCGGSSLGYKWAGFKELLAIDWDKNAEETFKVNFPDVPFWNKDITKVTGKEIMDFCGIRPGDLDIFDGSPPCQGFSLAGKKQVSDRRNTLYKEYIRLIIDLQPKVFIMENVPGMAIGNMRGIFNRILSELRGTGYIVSCRKLNAADYGVPQNRRRLVFIGTRRDIYNSPLPEILPRKRQTARIIDTVRNSTEDIALSKKELSPSIMKILIQMKPGESGGKYHPKGSFFTHVRIDPSKPSPIIIKTFNTYHYRDNRRLTIPEVKALCSFPEDFKLAGRFRDQWARLGNAVMPKFMEAVALHIRKYILDPYYTKEIAI